MRHRTRRTGRAVLLVAVVVGVVVGSAVHSAVPAGAEVAARTVTPLRWAERVCRGLVEFQAAGLDARDLLLRTARAPAPSDAPARAATVRPLRDAVRTVRTRLAALDATLGDSTPSGRDGAAAAGALRTGLAAVVAAYDTAGDRVAELRTMPPGQLPGAAGRLLRRLDRELERAIGASRRSERVVARSAAGEAIRNIPVCRPIGLEWDSVPATSGSGRTPAPPATTPDTPGGDDLTAPALLLPGRYRPTPAIAALAARTAMTGLGRTFFYGAAPTVETGSAFLTDCPSADSPTAQILGCYRDGRIAVLEVTRPEIAAIVTVTAAHEMLHAAYDATPDRRRTEIDGLLAAFYAVSTDTRLRQIVGQYEQRAPENIATELHSLVATQVAALTPALDRYYATLFRDRAPVLADYEAYVSVFEGLIARYQDLYARIVGLGQRIDGLRGESDAAATDARQLAARIEALRVQGRVAESNALVPAQNDAARRAQSLTAQANALVDEHNALVGELNAIAADLGGLQSSLRPLG